MAEQSLGASAATAELGATKNDLGGSTMADTKLLETTMHEGMTLIDRFYNGGNTAHPHALDILVVVLDNVVRRMRQQYATRKDSIAESNKQIARCDSNVDMIKPKQTKLQAELEEKRARAKELKDKIAQGANAINSSVDVAKAALEKANLLQRSIERQYIAGCKLGEKGYDSKGRALPGREENLRKTPVAARKAGDLALSDDSQLLAKVDAVMRGSTSVSDPSRK